jgi:uncharacterized protein (DUF58 family)
MAPAEEARLPSRLRRSLAVTPEDLRWWRRGGFFSLQPSPGMLRLRRWGLRLYRDRLTPRGRFLLWSLVVFAVLGADPRRSQVFVLFAAGAGLLLTPTLLALLPRPRVHLAARLPARLTARTPVALRVSVHNTSGRPQPDLVVRLPEPDQAAPLVSVTPSARHVALGAGDSADVTLNLEASRRGRYVLRGPAVAAVDPLRLVASASVGGAEQAVLVYPRFYAIESFAVPVGRRYQPGGIPLSSYLGDSIEFVGTREYRQGDPLRSIHWRSWARRGEPVVKEYQEEYFCRLALILDTFLPRKPTPREAEAFEAAISVLASIADHFSRSEYVVDILAAGPDVYEVSAGRSLAYLENILDVLACLEPCHETPFERIGPHLFEKLAQLTTVVAVLLDWDERREAFLGRVKAHGTQVQALIVRAGDTSRAWHAAAGELGEISAMTPEDVERRLAASGATRGPGAASVGFAHA